MREPRTDFRHINQIAMGFLVMGLRLVALFGVLGMGYAVYEYLGIRWFYVFIFAIIAVRVHFEVWWVERHYREIEEQELQTGRIENPFRKR